MKYSKKNPKKTSVWQRVCVCVCVCKFHLGADDSLRWSLYIGRQSKKCWSVIFWKIFYDTAIILRTHTHTDTSHKEEHTCLEKWSSQKDGVLLSTYQYTTRTRKADLRWKDARRSQAPSLTGWVRAGEEARWEELLKVRTQDTQVRGVVDASAVDGILQQAMHEVPLELFTTLGTSVDC